jgi:hypothetical protein
VHDLSTLLLKAGEAFCGSWIVGGSALIAWKIDGDEDLAFMRTAPEVCT